MDERQVEERNWDASHSGTPSLKAAIRRARIEAAAHTEAVDDVRRGEFARLEILEDAIRPIIAQAPMSAEIFDIGISQSEKPRLFVDMTAYVDLAADRRTYRFYQNTRHGRVLIAENARVERIVVAITNYVARRLIEFERSLESELGTHRISLEPTAVEPLRPRRGWRARQARADRLDVLVDLAGFLLMTLGAFTLFALSAFGAWLVLSSSART
jgi:hypothetical protein